MAAHIDKTLLDTDLRYRFDYLSKFLNFTEDDITMLNTLSKIAHPLIPSVVEGLYQKLLDYDITKQYFLTQNYGFEGTMTTDEAQLTIKSEQMIFRINHMRKYLSRILRQRIWNDAFLSFLSNVGKMHTNMAGTHSINVDYVHINATFGYLEHILIDAVLSNDEIDAPTKKAALLAINKLFWIQNDLFSMHYIIASKNGH
ncbi:unnamed protein product [Rotaria sp. Silwood2]|nr:unnamed protein product [Rotaria sp. Silwood2]CAF4412270.1 unnamed protein product [Rotaria sp. Silwood2]